MSEDDVQREVEEATASIRALWPGTPRAGMILGTGLGSFARQIQVEACIDYQRIAHFPRTTALGHAGQLVCGTVAGQSVVAMEGRFHFYEGYSFQQIALPVRVMKQLGVDLLVISNASGGVHPRRVAGDLVVIRDHIHLFGKHLPSVEIGEAITDRPVWRNSPYDVGLSNEALAIARVCDFVAHQGVYAAVTGPNYETRAEYRLLRTIGADIVGMSTVPESLVAAQLGLRVLALSAVTNVCRPDQPHSTSGQEVQAVAESTEPKMRAIVFGLLSRLGPRD